MNPASSLELRGQAGSVGWQRVARSVKREMASISVNTVICSHQAKVHTAIATLKPNILKPGLREVYPFGLSVSHNAVLEPPRNPRTTWDADSHDRCHVSTLSSSVYSCIPTPEPAAPPTHTPPTAPAPVSSGTCVRSASPQLLSTSGRGPCTSSLLF